jgi:endo-1,4-beta-xylanase
MEWEGWRRPGSWKWMEIGSKVSRAREDTYKRVELIRMQPRTVKYDGSYNPKGPGYFSLYGWTRNPLIEYYIIEGWDVLAPGEPWTFRSNFTSLGTDYTFYTAQRVNKPSIEGTRTFTQYFSVRNEAQKKVGAVSGSINTGDHFDAWSKAGYRLGNFEQNMFMVTEAFANGTQLPSGTSTITVS